MLGCGHYGTWVTLQCDQGIMGHGHHSVGARGIMGHIGSVNIGYRTA